MDGFPAPCYGGYFLATRPRQTHPLQQLPAYHGSFKPELADYVIRHYSRGGDVVLDPFCGRGTVGVSALLHNRAAYLSDASPLACRIARAKLSPQPSARVAAWLDGLPFNSRKTLRSDALLPFFHPRTLGELDTLRRALAEKQTALTRWVELLALARLHGSSPGYCSTPTFDTIALSPPAQQRRLRQRDLAPVYKPVVPRLCAAARRATRRPVPVWYSLRARQSRVRQAPADRLPYPDGSAQLVVTSPPYLDQIDYAAEQWLRLWFIGRDATVAAHQQAHWRAVADWEEFMLRVFGELQRVVAPGGVCAVDIQPVRRNGQRIDLPRHCTRAAGQAGWILEAIYQQHDGHGRRFKAPSHADHPRVSSLLIFRK